MPPAELLLTYNKNALTGIHHILIPARVFFHQLLKLNVSGN